jgi:protein disulfide-isomerase
MVIGEEGGNAMRRTVLACVAVVMGMAFGMDAWASEWETDFVQASTNAKNSGLYMLVDFTGSDWCGWCIKLDEEVFSKKEFKEYAKENLVCVTVDFPRRKKQDEKLKQRNAELAEKYEVRGFPSIIILSPEGDLVNRTGYRDGGAAKYVDSLKEMIAKYEKENPGKAAKKKPAPATPKSEAGGGK